MHKTITDIMTITGGTWLGTPTQLDSTITAISTDSRNVAADSLFIPIIGENFDGHRFVEDALTRGAKVALWKRDHPLNPPRDMPILLVDDPLASLQVLASQYLAQVGCRVVAITGSNGKTTTKDIISSILRVRYRTHATQGNFNNEIGLPLTLLQMPENTEVIVLEMGMNHFGEIALLSKIAKPDVAVITNIGDAHIEYLGSRAGIADAKLEILVGMDDHGTLFFHGNESLIMDSLRFKQYPGHKVSCGVDGDFDRALSILENQGLSGLLLEDQSDHEQYLLPIPGPHNAQNAAFGIAVGVHYKLTAAEIRTGLAQVHLSKMRMELIRGKNGVTIINDAYNASLLSMQAALQFLAELTDWQRKIVVLGDIGELGEHGPDIHRQLGQMLDPAHFPFVYVTGTLSKHIVEGANLSGYHHVQYYDTKEELSQELQSVIDSNTILLVKASRFMQMESIVQSLLE